MKKYIALFSKLFLLLILIFAGVNIGRFAERKVWMSKKLKESVTDRIESSGVVCPSYGSQKAKGETFVYTVKEGDSLLSIASNQLGDSSRANEIISLNKDDYPGLIDQPRLLQAGWELELPLRNLGIVQHELKTLSGMVASYDGKRIGVSFNQKGTQYGEYSIQESTEIVGEEIGFGDCIHILVDDDPRGGSRVIRVYPQ